MQNIDKNAGIGNRRVINSGHEQQDNHARLPRSVLGAEASNPYQFPCRYFGTDSITQGSTLFLEQPAGKNYLHPATISEVKSYLSSLPSCLQDEIATQVRVISLEPSTRKNRAANLYGMSWNTSVYLLPVHESLVEKSTAHLRPHEVKLKIRYGAVHSIDHNNVSTFEWSLKSIRDFYLCEVLLHEIGHALDPLDRDNHGSEVHADAFAERYGYLPWKAKQGQRAVIRRHSKR